VKAFSGSKLIKVLYILRYSSLNGGKLDMIKSIGKINGLMQGEKAKPPVETAGHLAMGQPQPLFQMAAGNSTSTGSTGGSLDIMA